MTPKQRDLSPAIRQPRDAGTKQPPSALGQKNVSMPQALVVADTYRYPIQ